MSDRDGYPHPASESTAGKLLRQLAEMDRGKIAPRPEPAPPKPTSPEPDRTGEGGTIRPRYGERRPMMYHMFETEFRSMSALNGEATRHFSVTAFLVGVCADIWISSTFSTAPPTAAAELLLNRGLPLGAMLAVIFFLWGLWAMHSRNTLVGQIEKETVLIERRP